MRDRKAVEPQSIPNQHRHIMCISHIRTSTFVPLGTPQGWPSPQKVLSHRNLVMPKVLDLGDCTGISTISILTSAAGHIQYLWVRYNLIHRRIKWTWIQCFTGGSSDLNKVGLEVYSTSKVFSFLGTGIMAWNNCLVGIEKHIFTLCQLNDDFWAGKANNLHFPSQGILLLSLRTAPHTKCWNGYLINKDFHARTVLVLWACPL